LFHNGTPVAGDGYRYYAYTAIEAEAMVKAAHVDVIDDVEMDVVFSCDETSCLKNSSV
jgi:hypothetical protein